MTNTNKAQDRKIVSVVPAAIVTAGVGVTLFIAVTASPLLALAGLGFVAAGYKQGRASAKIVRDHYRPRS